MGSPEFRDRFSSSFVRATAVQALSNGMACADRAGADKLPRCAAQRTRPPAVTGAAQPPARALTSTPFPPSPPWGCRGAPLAAPPAAQQQQQQRQRSRLLAAQQELLGKRQGRKGLQARLRRRLRPAAARPPAAPPLPPAPSAHAALRPHCPCLRPCPLGSTQASPAPPARCPRR
jgi:hypothetical protein